MPPDKFPVTAEQYVKLAMSDTYRPAPTPEWTYYASIVGAFVAVMALVTYANGASGWRWGSLLTLGLALLAIGTVEAWRVLAVGEWRMIDHVYIERPSSDEE